MYLQTLSTSDLETENADPDSCQANLPMQRLFAFMNRSTLSATMVASDSSDILGDRTQGSVHAQDSHKWSITWTACY